MGKNVKNILTNHVSHYSAENHSAITYIIFTTTTTVFIQLVMNTVQNLANARA